MSIAPDRPENTQSIVHQVSPSTPVISSRHVGKNSTLVLREPILNLIIYILHYGHDMSWAKKLWDALSVGTSISGKTVSMPSAAKHWIIVRNIFADFNIRHSVPPDLHLVAAPPRRSIGRENLALVFLVSMCLPAGFLGRFTGSSQGERCNWTTCNRVTMCNHSIWLESKSLFGLLDPGWTVIYGDLMRFGNLSLKTQWLYRFLSATCLEWTSSFQLNVLQLHVDFRRKESWGCTLVILLDFWVLMNRLVQGCS